MELITPSWLGDTSPWGAAIAAGGAIIGGMVQGNAAKSAANTQANAATSAAQLQAAQKQPWVDAGKGGLATLSAGLAPGGQFTKRFSAADAVNSPAEQQALSAGVGAINNSNAAKSGTLNTNALHETTQFAEGNAALYENQAFQQWQAQQAMQLGATESLAQTGQTAAISSGDSSANLMVGAGNAQAAGQIGQANAVTGALSQLGNLATTRIPSSPNTPGSTGLDASYTGDPYASSGELDSAFSLSDKRAKKNVKKVGKTDDGLPIYTFEMKEGDGETKMGVMAQDVEKKKPSAVRTNRHGYKMVDYSKVH